LINQREEKSYTQKQEELSALFFRSGRNQKTNGKRPLMIFHERSRFAACQWEFSKPTDISNPIHRLVLRALETGEWLSALKK